MISSSTESASAPPFTLGVNYWPRNKAMYWWKHFDSGEVQAEFAVIRELGLDMVRLFLLWEDFQPDPTAVSSTAIQNLVMVCDAAADNHLRLNITFFTGHMSGPNWSPHWLLTDLSSTIPRPIVSNSTVVQNGYRNPFHDPTALNAERLQIQAVVTALRDHPAVGIWNLGNEADLFAHPQDSAAGQAWTHDKVASIRALDTQHPVTFGLHTDSLLLQNGLRVDQIYAETDLAVMHAYPMYQPWVRSPLDPDFVPFCCALTAQLSGKPVLIEEFGGPTLPPGSPSEVLRWKMRDGTSREQFMASEEDLANYFEAVLPRLHESGATGALLWCFADYAESLWDRPPCDEFIHERHFGLIRPDGTQKPHAETIRRFAASKPTVQPIPAWAKLVIAAEPYYQDPAAHMQRLYQIYLHQRETALGAEQQR